MKVSGKRLIRLLGPVLLVYFLYKFDLSKIIQAGKRVEVYILLAAVLIHIPVVAVKTFRWQLLLKRHQIKINFCRAGLAYFSSLFFGLLTPGRLGELARFYYLKRDAGVAASRGLSSVFADRLFDVVFLVCMGCAVLLFFKEFSIEKRLFLTAVLILFLAFPLKLFLSERIFKKLRQLFKNQSEIVNSIFQRIEVFWTGLQEISKIDILICFFLTVPAYALTFFQSWIVAVSLGIDVSFIRVCYVISLSSLASLIPVTVSGIGTREAIFITYLGAFGFEPEMAITYSIFVFAVSYFGAILLGLFAWLIDPIPFKTLSAS